MLSRITCHFKLEYGPAVNKFKAHASMGCFKHPATLKTDVVTQLAVMRRRSRAIHNAIRHAEALSFVAVILNLQPCRPAGVLDLLVIDMRAMMRNKTH